MTAELDGQAAAEMPTVTIGGDMSPEMFVDVATALRGMGVNVRTETSLPPQQKGKVIVVLSPKGGSGKTAVTSNLAVALAQRHPGRVVAVDLDVQFGDLPTALSLISERTLAQLSRATSIGIDASAVGRSPNCTSRSTATTRPG